MATIALTTTDTIEVFDSDTSVQLTAIAKVAITAGWVIRLDTDGQWIVSLASSAAAAAGSYVAGYTVPVGLPVTGFRVAKLDGLVLAALDFGAAVYISDTGTLSSTAGTDSIVVGRVVPGMSERSTSAPKKLLAIDLPL